MWPKKKFRSISMKFFLGKIQTISRKKKFLLLRKKKCYAVECEPGPTRVLNLKAGGVQERSPGGGCGGVNPPAKKKY